MSPLKRIKKASKHGELQEDTNLADSEELFVEGLSTDEADVDLSEVKSIQEFIEMKRRQNQILEKLLEKITKPDKQK
ncbi:MAG: hypothetical protein EOM83_07425 [Clostridia bacterium]|nr:hypothetical protein [Clostridia bacterium]